MLELPKQRIANSGVGLTIVESAKRSAQEALERMRPLFELAIKFHRHNQEALAPTINSALAFQEAAKPVLQTILTSQKAFADMVRTMRPVTGPDTRIIIPLPTRRYQSAEDVAEVLFKKLEQRGQAKQRTKSLDKEKTIPVPDGTQWNELRIDLKDNRTVDVFHKKERLGNYDYESLGLVRRNTDRKVPDRQGELLKLLAIASIFGGSFKPTISAIADHMNISGNACQQIKKSLSRKLQIAFGIQGSPFHRYDPVAGYRTRFELRPEALLRGDGEIHASGGSLYDEATDYTEN